MVEREGEENINIGLFMLYLCSDVLMCIFAVIALLIYLTMLAVSEYTV